jgi:hypothetical protein
MTLEPGLRAAFRYTVTGADTAAAFLRDVGVEP